MMTEELHINDYFNIIDDFRLSSADIEAQIASYDLRFPDIRNNDAENGRGVPPFVPAFYMFVSIYHRVPTADEAFGFLLDMHKDDNILLTRPDLYEAVRARFRRAYPSLVRDLHFGQLVRERLPKEYKAYYNIELDLKHDIDLLVITPHAMYSACLFTNTQRGNDFRGVKENRHLRFSNVKYIELSLNDSNAKVIGKDKFWLYTEHHFALLMDAIRSEEAKFEGKPAPGHCIRCGAPISYEFGKVKPRYYCKSCWSQWFHSGADETLKEKYCHCCGKENPSSYLKPLCYGCWKKN